MTVRAELAARGCAVQARVFTGGVSTALLDYEQEAGIGLVIIARADRDGAPHAPAGSLAATLLRRGHAPLLRVRGVNDPISMEHALAPLDGSVPAEESLYAVEELPPAVVRTVATAARDRHGGRGDPLPGAEGRQAGRHGALVRVAREAGRSGAREPVADKTAHPAGDRYARA